MESPELLQRAKVLLASKRPEIELVQPGRFFEDPTFLDNLPASLLKTICDFEELSNPPGRAALYSMFGETALIRSIDEASQTQENLLTAIVLCAISLKHVIFDDPRRETGKIISVFARVLRRNWEITRQKEDLEDVIYYFRHAITFGTPDDPYRPFHFDDLARSLYERYKLIHESTDITEAMKAFDDAIACNHSATALFLSNKAKLILEAAVFERSINGIESAISTHQLAVSRVTGEYRGSVAALRYPLALAYIARHNLSSDLNYVDKAIAVLDEAVNLSPPKTKIWYILVHEQAAAYLSRFRALGHTPDADQAVQRFRLYNEGFPEDYSSLSAYGDVLRRRAERTASVEDFTTAISLLQQSVMGTKESDPEFPVRLTRCSEALLARFKSQGKQVDVDVAIELWRLALTSPAVSGISTYWIQLSDALLQRFDACGNADDLVDALASVESATTCSKRDDEDLPLCLDQHGRILIKQYQTTKEPKHMEQAIAKFENALSLYRNGTTSYRDCLNELGKASYIKFQQTGHSEDSTKAVKSFQAALNDPSQDNEIVPDARRAMYIHNLGNVLLLQFERWRDSSDIDNAIVCYREALNMSHDSATNRVTRAGSLAWALIVRYKFTYAQKDIDEAVQQVQDALSLPAAKQLNAANRISLQSNLGAAYLLSHSQTKDQRSLNAAITHLRKATSIEPRQAQMVYAPSLNLAMALEYKAKVTRKPIDYLAVVSQYMIILETLKEDDPNMYSFLYSAAGFMTNYYDDKREKKHGNTAIWLYNCLRHLVGATPERRIYAAIQAARLCYEINGDARSARDILNDAVQLLPEAMLLSLKRLDQLQVIKETPWLSSHLFAFSLEAGDPSKDAVRLLESSRSFIWNRLLDQKAIVPALHENHPELANQFEKLREELSLLHSSNRAKTASAAVVTGMQTFRLRSREAAIEYTNLIATIRQQAGFEDFLQLPAAAQRLQEYAYEGPIVIINVCDIRSDAVIIRSDNVVNLQLSFTRRDCSTLSIALSLMHSDPDQASTRFEEALQCMWKAIAEPVLDSLGFTGPSDERGEVLPRIWWMMTGAATPLPLHAAGDHKRALETGMPCTVLDRVVSSYIPTLKALSFAREIVAADIDIPRHSALLVQMPSTPDNADLLYAAEEVSAIHSSLQLAGCPSSILNQPKKSEVLAKLESCTIAHFACHATSNEEDPSRSQLQLQDWKTPQKLDVRALLKLATLTRPPWRLVYLSACETAVNKDAKLQEEGIHIAGGFQMAGVPYVVGTLWEIEDRCSVDVAQGFYSGLVSEDGIEFGKSARSLHAMIKELRDKGMDALLWAAYIHSGA